MTQPPTAAHRPRTTPSRRQRLGFAACTLGLAASSLAFVGLAAPAAQAAISAPACAVSGSSIACTVSYSYAGAEESFTVPTGVTSLDVTAVGGTGGHFNSTQTPGRGAVVTGQLTTTPGTVLYVAVGQTGGYIQSGVFAPVFNGGGTPGLDSGSGGGATDVRTMSRNEEPTSSLLSRLVVAGGGGGNDDLGSGGDAGLNGQTPPNGGSGQGGTQTSGGAPGSGATAGSLGQGGSGADPYGAGGGGGLYGGGGGTTFQGGGGGSSLVPTDGSVSVNTTGQAPHVDFTYSRPITGATAVTPEDATTTAGTPVTYGVTLTDGYETATGEATTLDISPSGTDTGASCSASACSATKVGTYQITATSNGFQESTTLTVEPGPVATTQLTPADVSVTAGDPVIYSVTGVDAYGNQLDDQTGASTITVAPADGGDPVACPRGVCRVTEAGSYLVTSTTPGGDGDVVTTTTLDVQPDVLASLTVTPGTAQTLTGVAVTYTVTGSDRFGNDLGDLTDQAVLRLVPVADGDAVDCDGADCTPYIAGTYRVEVLVDGVSGEASLNASATRATITVDPEGDTDGLTFGDDVPVSAVVASPDGPVPSGRVQFSLDGDAVGLPVAVDPDGAAQVPAVEDVDAGLHTLRADFASEPDGAYTLASSQTSFVTARATTATQVSTSPGSVTAVVSAGALPAPTGRVTFTLNGRDLGTADVVDGTAVLPTDTTIASDATVTARYGGATNYLPSTGSTARQDPTIVARVAAVSGAAPVGGWYRGPVSVSFTCAAGSAPLTCPAPVVLDHEGAGQTVTRTVVASDGGVAMVTAGPVNIDLTAPVAKVAGVTQGAVYNGPASGATCAGSDALSGLATCTVTTTGQFPGTLQSTATVVDQAGNTTTSTVTYRRRDLWVGKADPVKGAWPVLIGKSVSLLVASKHRPELTGRLVRPGDGFRWAGYRDGVARWVSVVRVPAKVEPGETVRYKVEIGGVTRKVYLRAVKH